MTDKIVIQTEQHVFADEFLDIVGNPFGSDHAKGLAEWIKNSADAYNREIDTKGRGLYPDEVQHIFLRISGKRPLVYECIDFVGMSKDDIDKAVKRWGDPKAASRGKKGDFLGGHGNGGKLYMRQMFKTSQFITYRDGHLNIFGFDSKGRYGFAKGFENKKVAASTLIKDLELSSLISQLPANMQKRAHGKNAGFTIARGIGPKNLKGARNSIGKIIDRLCNHPQVRRPIAHKRVFVIIGARDPFRLMGQRIIPKAGFENPVVVQIPKKIQLGSDTVELANAKFPAGELILRTSEKPFGGRGHAAARAVLNCVEYLVGRSVVGVDRLTELGGLRNHVETEFIYGECQCPILDDPKMRSVDNDRENLILNDRVLALRLWISNQINELTDKMAERTRREQNVKDLEQSSKFNEFLNKWISSKDLLAEIRATILGGKEKGDAFGQDEWERNKKDKKDKNKKDKNKNKKPPGSGSGDNPQRGPKNLRVLLSNFDQDPQNTIDGVTVDCSPRQPPVYQRDIDVEEGIFWINTQNPLAKLIRDDNKDGAESTRWREYMFQRHTDILFKQSLYDKEKKEIELNAAQVDKILDDVTGKISKLAAEDSDMQQFLFGKKF